MILPFLPVRAALVLLVLILGAACGDDGDGAGGSPGSSDGGGGSAGDGGGAGGLPEGCECPIGDPVEASCEADHSGCFPLDCGDGVPRQCQTDEPPPATCPEGEIDFGGECPETVDCHVVGSPLSTHCAAPVPCTDAAEPIGACASPGETCSPAVDCEPAPEHTCGDDHVWARTSAEDCG